MTFTSVDDITLGAVYKDSVTGVQGVAITKTQCLTGCDRVTLQQRDSDAKVLSVDVTCVDFVDEGVAERFSEVAAHPDTKPGGPPVMGTSLR